MKNQWLLMNKILFLNYKLFNKILVATGIYQGFVLSWNYSLDRHSRYRILKFLMWFYTQFMFWHQTNLTYIVIILCKINLWKSVEIYSKVVHIWEIYVDLLNLKDICKQMHVHFISHTGRRRSTLSLRQYK